MSGFTNSQIGGNIFLVTTENVEKNLVTGRHVSTIINNTSRLVHNSLTGERKPETPDARQKKDVASVYNEDAKVTDLSIEGRSSQPKHPIGGLQVLANSRKLTAAVTSPQSPETAYFMRKIDKKHPIAEIDQEKTNDEMSPDETDQKFKSNGGDELNVEWPSMQLSRITPQKDIKPLTPPQIYQQSEINHQRMPYYKRLKLFRIRQAPPIDRSLLMQQSNVLQVSSIPTKLSPIRQNQRKSMNEIQSPNMQIKEKGMNDDEVENSNDLPMQMSSKLAQQLSIKDKIKFVKMSNDSIDRNSKINTQRQPNDYREPLKSLSVTPKRMEITEYSARHNDTTNPVNFSLLLNAKKRSQTGMSQQNFTSVTRGEHTHNRRYNYESCKSDNLNELSLHIDSHRINGQTHNRQDISSDSVSQCQNNILKGPTSFIGTFGDGKQQNSNRVSLGFLCIEKKSSIVESKVRSQNDDEYGMNAYQKQKNNSNSSIEIGGRSMKHGQDGSSSQIACTGQDIETPILVAKSSLPYAKGRSQQCQRKDGLSTDRKLTAKLKENRKKINYDIMETMGGKKTARRAQIHKLLSHKGQKKDLEEEIVSTVMVHTNRRVSSSSGVSKLQIGIIGQSAVMSRNKHQKNLRSSDKHETDKLYSTSQSIRPFQDGSKDDVKRGNISNESKFGSKTDQEAVGSDQFVSYVQKQSNAPQNISLEKTAIENGFNMKIINISNQNSQALHESADRVGHEIISPEQLKSPIGNEQQSLDSLEKYDEKEMARIATDIQQFILQESQTNYNFTCSFDRKRGFNHKIMNKLKIQAALSRAKRNKTALNGQDNSIVRRKSSKDKAMDQIINQVVQTTAQEARFNQKDPNEMKKIIIFGVNSSKGNNSSEYKNTSDQISAHAQSPNKKGALETARLTIQAGNLYHLKSLYEHSDQRSLYNDSILLNQTADKLLPNFTSRNGNGGYEITSLYRASRTKYRKSVGQDYESKRQDSMTLNPKSPRANRQKHHIVEIGSFSLIPETRVFGEKIELNTSPLKMFDKNSLDKNNGQQNELVSTQRSRNNSVYRSNDVLNQNKDKTNNKFCKLDENNEPQRPLQFAVQNNLSNSLTSNKYGNSQQVTPQNSGMNQSVLDSMLSRPLESKGSDKFANDNIDILLMGASREVSPAESFPESKSPFVNKKKDTPIQQKIIDEKEEYLTETHLKPIQQYQNDDNQQDGQMNQQQSQQYFILNEPVSKNKIQALSNEDQQPTETAHVPISSQGQDQLDNIEQTFKKIARDQDSYDVNSNPSSQILNTTLIQNLSCNREQQIMANTSYGRIYQDNIGNTNLKVSDQPLGNQRIHSPVTEHAYLKVDSILSHGDDMMNTYGMNSGQLVGGTTFSSPRGFERHQNVPFMKNHNGKQRRLGSRPELQNQVVFQVMGGQSQRKNREEMRISEQSRSIKETQQKDHESIIHSDGSKTGFQDHDMPKSRQSDFNTDFRSKKSSVPPLNIQSPGQTCNVSKASQSNLQEINIVTQVQNTERSQGLDQQAENFQIQEAIKQLQIVLRQKQKQFKIKNSVQVHKRKGSMYQRQEWSPLSRRAVLPELSQVDQNKTRSRLVDYFKDPQAQSKTTKNSLNQSAIGFSNKVFDAKMIDFQKKIREQNSYSQMVSRNSMDISGNMSPTSIPMKRFKTNLNQLKNQQFLMNRQKGSEKNNDNGRNTFNSNRGWRSRTQNFSMANVFHVKKRLQIENMVNCNFPKMQQLSHRALDYGNVNYLPSILERKRLYDEQKRPSERSRKISRPDTNSPTSECAVDELIQIVSPKKQLITNIAPNTCSTQGKMKYYKKITNDLEQLLSHTKLHGDSTQSIENMKDKNQSKFNRENLKSPNPSRYGLSEQIEEQESSSNCDIKTDNFPTKENLKEKVIPLNNASFDRNLNTSNQNLRKQHRNSNAMAQDNPGFNFKSFQQPGRLESQQMPRGAAAALRYHLQPMGTFSGLSNGNVRSLLKTQTDIRSQFSSCDMRPPKVNIQKIDFLKVEKQHKAVPYALPESNFQSFEQNHKEFYDVNRKGMLSRQEKIEYLLNNI